MEPSHQSCYYRCEKTYSTLPTLPSTSNTRYTLYCPDSTSRSHDQRAGSPPCANTNSDSCDSSEPTAPHAPLPCRPRLGLPCYPLCVHQPCINKAMQGFRKTRSSTLTDATPALTRKQGSYINPRGGDSVPCTAGPCRKWLCGSRLGSWA